MGTGKEMVITAYGHDNVIDKIAVSSFDNSTKKDWQHRNDSDAHTYCEMLNDLKLMGASWIFANIIPEKTPVALSLFLPFRFHEMIKKISDRSLQKVFREFNNRELATAFKGCGEDVLEKISRNMSTEAYQILNDDMEPIESVNRKNSQDKFINIIRHLQDTGEIIIDRSGEEVIVS
jgi:hypothetical protein